MDLSKEFMYHDPHLAVCERDTETNARYPDSKVHGANMGPIWELQDPGGPHVGAMNLAIWVQLHDGVLLYGNPWFWFIPYFKMIRTMHTDGDIIKRNEKVHLHPMF